MLQTSLRTTVSVLFLFWAANTPATAQILSSDGSNKEGRNAYQEGCFINNNFTLQNCTLPPPPAGKRIAIRWLTAMCDSAAGRVERLTLFARISTSQTEANLFSSTAFRPISVPNINGGGDQIVSEPVYGYSDFAPVLSISATRIFDSTCRVQVRGFLTDKP